ncbi:hypothetical protein QCA50_000852 [Cerrena zonata]|uniref:Uncharacterized protein n=1 Tax=Cerrena zonata TaxID=2478898 RepID=A0AAW0GXG3_9APHY
MRRNSSFASTASDVSVISSAPSWPDISLFVSPPPPSRSPSPTPSIQGSNYSDTFQSERGSNIATLSARTRTSNSPMQQRREDNIKDELRVNGRRVNPLFTPTHFPAPSGPPVIRRHPIQHHDSITPAPSGSGPQLAASDSSSELEDNSITPRGSVNFGYPSSQANQEKEDDVLTEIASQASSASIGTFSSASTGPVVEQDTIGRMDKLMNTAEKMCTIYRANTKDSLSAVNRVTANGGEAGRVQISEKRDVPGRWLVVIGKQYALKWLVDEENLLRQTVVEDETKIRKLERQLQKANESLDNHMIDLGDMHTDVQVALDKLYRGGVIRQAYTQIRDRLPWSLRKKIRSDVDGEWARKIQQLKESVQSLTNELERAKADHAQTMSTLRDAIYRRERSDIKASEWQHFALFSLRVSVVSVVYLFFLFSFLFLFLFLFKL